MEPTYFKTTLYLFLLEMPNLIVFIMKKTCYFVLAMAICSITTVSAEKVNLCQAFQKLSEQCDDFSAWKGAKLEDSYGDFSSTLELEGGERTKINEFLGDVTFKVEYGKFDAESVATAKVAALKKELITCFPVLKFTEARGSFNEALSYIVHSSDQGFRFYKACFKIAKYGQKWHVTFEFPQTKKEGFGKKDTKPYTDYQRIKEAADQTPLSLDIRRLLVEANTGFASIKGEKLDRISMFDTYDTKFVPTGSKDCYIEDRGMGIVFFEIPIIQNATVETIQNNAANVIKSVQQTLGPDYGFVQSSDGMSVRFAHSEHPYYEAAMLYIEKILDGYYLTLSIKAVPMPVSK